jgi:hypothetical protein
MRGKGITYDTGFLTAGGSTHEPFNPDLVQSEMQIVRDDLKCNAVRITGGNVDRLEIAATHAAAAPVFQERHTLARQRQAVIAANPGLQERELSKRAVLATAMADALRGRGVPEPAASLAAEVGVIAFKTAFARWVDDPHEQDLARLIRQALDQLKAAPAGTGSSVAG